MKKAHLLVVFIPALILTGCLEGGIERKAAGVQQIQVGDPDPAPGLPPGAAFGFSAAPAALTSQNLDTMKSVPITVQAASSFSGPVTLTIDRSELDLIDRDAVKDVSVSVTPAMVNLSAGGQANVVVSVRASAFSRSFANSKVVLVGTAGPDSARVDVPITVAAVYQANLAGGTPPERFEMPQSVSLRAHTPSVKVRFTNLDSAREHIIHGQAGIPHQNTAQPLAVAVGANPGGTYEVTFAGNIPAGTGQFWCHTHEQSNQAHMILYNQDR